jgi:hypothetical protein
MSVFAAIPVIFVGFFFTVVVLVTVYAISAVRKERRRREQLQAYAGGLGWQPINGPAPEPVAADVRSLWLGPGYPDIELRRRTGIGALLKPVRGAGTGDAAFDRAFFVRTGDGYEHLRLLTPQLRNAMLDRRVPLWQLTGGVLVIGYGDVPRVENLQYRADVICHLAGMLG